MVCLRCRYVALSLICAIVALVWFLNEPRSLKLGVREYQIVKTKRELLMVMCVMHFRQRPTLASGGVDWDQGRRFFALRVTALGSVSIHQISGAIDAIPPLHECEMSRTASEWVMRNTLQSSEREIVIDDSFGMSARRQSDNLDQIETECVRRAPFFVGEDIEFAGLAIKVRPDGSRLRISVNSVDTFMIE